MPNTTRIRRTQAKNIPTKEQLVASTREDLQDIFQYLIEMAGKLDGADFMVHLSRITHLFGRLRGFTLVNYGFKYKKPVLKRETIKK